MVGSKGNPGPAAEGSVEPKSDLAGSTLPELAWGPGHNGDSIRRLFRPAEYRGLQAVSWYLSAKKPKAKRSRQLRLVAIGFTALGTLLPLIAAANRRVDARWGYVFLALAAACVGADRFFGYSSAWIRYMGSSAILEQDLAMFQIEWATLEAKWGGGEPTEDMMAECLAAIAAFIQQVLGQIRTETEAWMKEFTSNLAQLEAATRAKGAAPAEESSQQSRATGRSAGDDSHRSTPSPSRVPDQQPSPSEDQPLPD